MKNIRDAIEQETENIKDYRDMLQTKIENANATILFNQKLIKLTEIYEQHERDKIYPNSY